MLKVPGVPGCQSSSGEGQAMRSGDTTMSTVADQIRVLAGDDHPIAREGIARLIVTRHDMVLVR
jgi:hypothetical protein